MSLKHTNWKRHPGRARGGKGGEGLGEWVIGERPRATGIRTVSRHGISACASLFCVLKKEGRLDTAVVDVRTISRGSDTPSMRVGVDEAGKGPVVGSMFAAAVRAPTDALPEGVDDSKKLAPARREDLDRRLRADDRVRVAVVEISVERIDGDTDMNALTVAAHAEALARAAADGDRALVDAGEVDAERFAWRVRDGVPADIAVRAEHRADETDPLVGAASVVAKVARDAHVAALSERHAAYGGVGSGYPSDPDTRAFLREYVRARGHLPECARESWSTCDDVLAAAEQRALDEF